MSDCPITLFAKVIAMSKNDILGSVDSSAIESQMLDQIEETGKIANPSIDPTDPSYDWVSMLSMDEVNPYYGGNGKRVGASEKPIAGMTPPEFAEWLIGQANDSPANKTVAVLIDGKDFQLGSKELSSIVARFRNALCVRKRGERNLSLLRGEIGFQAIPKGQKMVRAGKVVGELPQAIVRISYQLHPEEISK